MNEFWGKKELIFGVPLKYISKKSYLKIRLELWTQRNKMGQSSMLAIAMSNW
jgi:hypothetical protein